MPYNPETLDGFRRALREKYKTLDGLNDAWKCRYGSWSEVDPPRMYFSVPSFIDWSRYIHEGYIAGTLGWRRRVLRAADSKRRPVAAHTATPYFGTTCEFNWSKKLDLYGTSFYPTVAIYQHWEERAGMMEEAFSRYQELWSSLFHINYSRCASGTGPRFMLHEMACGPYNDAFTVRAGVSESDLRRWLLLQLAAGSTGAIVWNTRPEYFWNEAQGQGFLDADGRLTPRARALGSFGKALEKHGTLLARSVKPLAPVALFQDEELFRFAQGSGQVGLVVESLRGCYKACFDAGVDADSVDGNRIDEESLSAYRVVVHPFPAVMSDAVAGKLTRYVENGGILICGPVPARFDEYGFARLRFMSPAAERLLGVRHESIRQVAEFEGRTRWTPKERRYGDLVPPTRLSGVGPLLGLQLKAALYIQTYDVSSANPVLLWGDRVVGVKNQLGEGTVYLFGTSFSLAILGEKCGESQRLFEELLRLSGVGRSVNGPLVLYERVGDSGTVLFVVNPSSEPVEWDVRRSHGGTVEDLLTGERSPADSRIEIEAFDVRAFIERRAVEQ